ncbi:putative secreted protein (Por secretion system target) [Lacibacter cauensis]|uniref:Putative secreted protein (Por secretion system target) n=1 Tax=Lacibacter cauensis TaxID=510947 RepID=A0A562SJD2_9BACT|nr:T9SS type A sorting domain-containing protein [Lacibacter cauensis]TWI81268.1 putative secreted protein (Por secretion system target) [Lacibacter cauensis]
MKLLFNLYRSVFLFGLFFLLPFAKTFAQNECATAIALTSSTACNNTNINLSSATASSGIPLGCAAAGTYNDYWFTFTAQSTTHTITLSNLGTRITAPRIQLYSGSCGSLTSVACSSSPHTSLTQTGLTVGATYYVRISQYGAFGGAGNYKADICITHPVAPPANDDCSGSTLLTSSTACTNTSSTLYYATSSTGTIPTGCSVSGTVYEVWFRFVATATTQRVTLSSLGSSLTSASTYVQMFSSSTGLCGGTLTSLGCSAASSPLSVSSLTVGTTYYVRVFVSSNPIGISSAAYAFNICVQQSGGNDACANAIQLISSTTCTSVAGTLNGATSSGSLFGGSCGVAGAADVWYSFVAQSTNPTVSFTNGGIPTGNPGAKVAAVQVLSGTCAGLTSLYCSTGTGTITISTSALTIGTTYYVRVFSNQTTTPTSAWTFSLCVTDAASNYAIETAKSYVNISKQNGGGSITVGDVLEIRATISITGTDATTPVDSLSFHDTLKAGAGFAYQTGTLAMRTNEGKIHGSVRTEAAGDDAGFAVSAGAGTDTIIRLNFGTGASATSGGSVTLSQDLSPVPTYPKTAAHNYLVMATYRVVVNRAEGTKINFGGGSFRYRDRTTGAFNVISLPKDSLVVYASPDVCPNAVSATNVIGDEYNGTFGTATGTNQQNRTPSANTNYVFKTFTSGTPNDNYYGITNNTASVGTEINRQLPIPTANTSRVFGVWDISGDHTGATDEARGNPPCDASQPVSPTNPCGYMMVFNAAYKTDTAFQFNVANACPNTYYEVAAWFKNVCYKCGQDSMGRGQWSGTSYIPTAANDTSGVKPNIAIKVNNLDYYNTGDITYQSAGVARLSTTADSANRWVRRAFVYKTDSVTTNFTLTLRNNAPGGGGNDWAIDDISFKTCSPTLQMTPNASQTFCANNQVDMRVYVESYYNMYQYYEWERSTDGGNTWGAAPEVTGPQTFSYTNMGNGYRDTVAYPPIIASSATNGYRYRIRVATTQSGLSNSCAVFNSDDVIVINVANPLSCSVLPADLLKFNVQLQNETAFLSWSVKNENLNGYEIESSKDGIHFTTIGFVKAKALTGDETNYTFMDPTPVSGKMYYRLKMEGKVSGNNKYSNTLSVTLLRTNQLEISNLVNPFSSQVNFQLSAYRNEEVELMLMDALGKPVAHKKVTVNKGVNAISLNVPQYLAKGSYLLRIVSASGSINKIIQKQ